MLQDLWLGILLNYIFLICFIQWARYDTMMKETWSHRLKLENEIDEFISKIVEDYKFKETYIKSIDEIIDEVAKEIKKKTRKR